MGSLTYLFIRFPFPDACAWTRLRMIMFADSLKCNLNHLGLYILDNRAYAQSLHYDLEGSLLRLEISLL